MGAEVHIVPADDLFVMMRKGLQPFAKNIRLAQKITIKVALVTSTQHYGSWIISSSESFDALLNSLTEINPRAKIYAVESDNREGEHATTRYRVWGYDLVAKKYPNVQLIELSHAPLTTTYLEGSLFETLQVPTLFLESDVIISFAKGKTHKLTQITGALKNMFGCIPNPRKERYHPFLAQAIVDVNTAMKPHIAIIDLHPAMQGEGPLKGKPLDYHCFLFSNDPVAADSVMARMMGKNPLSIPVIKACARKGIGTAKEIKVFGPFLRRPCEHIKPFQRMSVAFSMLTQRIGFIIHDLGHRLHDCKTLSGLAITSYILGRNVLLGRYRVRD